MKRNALIFSVLIAAAVMFLASVSAECAISDPMIIVVLDGKGKHAKALMNQAGEGYGEMQRLNVLSDSSLPYKILDYSDAGTGKYLEKNLQVTPQCLPLVAFVQMKEGNPSRMIIRFDAVRNLKPAIMKIGKLFKGEALAGVPLKGVKEVTCEKDGSTMVLIPAGPFLMGSYYGMGQKDEYPLHEVSLPAYYIDKYEVTNEQFKKFTDETGYVTKSGWERYYTEETGRHPVVNVALADAAAYAKWAGKRLPTEAEWEKAARGDTVRIYPWGSGWDKGSLNSLLLSDEALLPLMSRITQGRGTLPVGSFPGGASPYGVMDMAGNAEEWTASSYDGYPGAPFLSPDFGSKLKVARGGSWRGDNPRYFGTANRGGTYPPERAMATLGFRCARSQ
ncbi:MAG: formylglycine-generating enzyme family protein [Candidatus Eremiobacteraeota bacterium]|nr:formylglycine-generating enzyme family protein [Candidatus Eremiobacteraeota bacterium]